MKTKQQADADFVQFCRQATDSQLEEILRREWNAPNHRDYAGAERAAMERGWETLNGTVFYKRASEPKGQA